jgi:hypothetical protein
VIDHVCRVTPSLRLVVWILAVLLSGQAVGAPFVFDPSEADFIETAHTETTAELSGVKRNVLRKDKEIELKVRRIQSGFRFIQTLLKSDYSVDGATMEKTIGAELIGRPISVFFTRSGELTKISGYERVLDDTKRKAIPGDQKKVEKAFNPSDRLSELRRNWSFGPGMLIGRDSTVGTTWSEEKKLNPDPDVESATVYIQNRVVDLQTIEGEPVATVLSFLSTDRDMLKFVESDQIKSLDDERVVEFLAWNVATLPFQKYAQRLILKVNSLEFVESEQFSVESKKAPIGLLPRGRYGVETVKIRKLSRFRRTK